MQRGLKQALAPKITGKIILKELNKFLNKKFKSSKTTKLSELLSNIKHGKMIPTGTLVIMATGDTKLRLKILEKDTPHKGFSTPLLLNEKAKKYNISTNYLHWYLSHDDIRIHLMNYAKGSVLLRIPKLIIESIPVPIPINSSHNKTIKEIIIKKEDDGFRDLINSFYEDYLLNLKHERFRTAIILAGAMSEAIIYQLLLDEGVEKQILDKDRGLGLGKLITYTKLLKLGKSLNLPITHFAEIQKKRNSAIHIGSNRNNPTVFKIEDLESFNKIVKFYGI